MLVFFEGILLLASAFAVAYTLYTLPISLSISTSWPARCHHSNTITMTQLTFPFVASSTSGTYTHRLHIIVISCAHTTTHDPHFFALTFSLPLISPYISPDPDSVRLFSHYSPLIFLPMSLDNLIVSAHPPIKMQYDTCVLFIL